MQLNKIIAGALLLFPAIVFGQKTYTIQGEISGIKGPAVLYVRGGGEINDSVKVKKNGRFVLNGKLTEPMITQLLLVDKSRNTGSAKADYNDWSLFVLEPGVITITAKDSVKYATIQSPLNDERRADLEKSELRLVNQRKLEAAYQEAVTTRKQVGMAKQWLDLEMKAVATATLTYDLEYIKTHPDSYLSAWKLQKLAPGEDFVKVKELYEQFSPEIKNSVAGKYIYKVLDQRHFVEIGGTPPDFQQTDTAGKTINLYGFRGKYLLIDFWASWCGPCRKENPNVLAAYEAFAPKGLEILGVSLDEAKNKKDWIKAIDFDGLQWPQVCDFGGFNNKAAQLFNIRSIPQNVLIDPQGKIIAKNLRGEALQEALSKFIK